MKPWCGLSIRRPRGSASTGRQSHLEKATAQPVVGELAYARAYGPANNLNQVASQAGQALTFNANGNLSTFQGATYTWALGNRLVGVSRPGMTASYAYDGEDRRTMKTVDGVTTRTLWSGADEVAEMDAVGNILRRFIPDGSGAMDGRLASLEANGTIYWHHTDHQGSVVATSNASGAPVSLVNYSPNGELGTAADGTALTAPPTGSPFGYTGRQYDPETGLWQYRARYYHPQLGQFLSTDPIGTKDDPNLYMYVANDPVNNTDPTGMQTVFEIQQRHRDLGPGVADAQNREAADRVKDGIRAAINDIRKDPWGALADGAMIVGDVILGGPTGESAVGIGARRGAREGAEAAITRSTRTRSAPGRDGATSQVTTERMGDDVISTTHSVRSPDGNVVHQHQDHVGRTGSVRRFPDEWTGTRTVGDPPPPTQPIPRPRQ